jgi:hypothetical protein
MITAAQPDIVQASQAIGTAQAILGELVKRPRLGLKDTDFNDHGPMQDCWH